MIRKPATAATAAAGATVFTSRTGKVARTVVALDHSDLDVNGQPLVMAQRAGRYMESAHTLAELWVETPRG